MSPIADLRGKLAAGSARERRLLAGAALLLGLALLASLGEWAHRERARLALAVPMAESRLARMQQQAEELAQLERAPAPAEASVAVRGAAARAAAAPRGLALELEERADGLGVTGHGSPAAVLDWLAAMQAEQRLRPVELEIAQTDRELRFSGRLGVPRPGAAR